MNSTKSESGIKSFNFVYWLVIVFEFFERGAYYGMMSVLSIYMTEQLGFSKEGVGLIKGTIQPLLYFLPILTGAIADKMGYRKTLMVAFGLLGGGYFLTSQSMSYFAVFASLIIMGIGAGTFKPVVSGTIAKLTNEKNSSLGFGIFYWSINLGAFLFPMFLVPYLKSMDWTYVILASCIATGMLIIPTFFLFKEPPRPEAIKGETFISAFADIFKKIWVVILDWKFILLIFIYSWFWVLYFQMFDSVLWYMKDFVDATPLNNFINNIFHTKWYFDVEHVTVINALTIILLQLFVSAIVRKTKAMPTMITGIALGTIGMATLAISSNIWVFILGLFIFSLGEMTAHPKFIAYLGNIAPKDKKATYMGFGFLYGVFGSFIGSNLGAFLYVRFIDNPMISFIKTKLATINSSINISSDIRIADAISLAQNNGIAKADIVTHAYPSELWLVFSAIGVFCIIGLLVYQKFFGAAMEKIKD